MTPPPDLVGRERELEAILHVLDRPGDGPNAVLITGEAGIGKSSVWAAAVAAAAARGATVLMARPVEAELPMGYAGLADLLAAVITPVLPALPSPLAHALRIALQLGEDAAAADPQLVGRATLAALVELSRDHRLLIAIDDVQWLDGASARALAFALRRLGASTVTVAASLRSGHPDPLRLREAFAGECAELALTTLSLGAMGRMLRAGTPSLSRRAVTRIHERSGGNPFFGLQLAAAPDADQLPVSIRDSVDAGLEGVPVGGNGAIELVAIRGPQPLSAFDDPVGLDIAVVAGMLHEDSGAIRFVHPLIAERAHDRIPPARRRALHRQAADVASNVEIRARHVALGAGGPSADVATFLDDAARSARLRGAPETSSALMAHAIRLTPPELRDTRARRTMDRVDDLFVTAEEAAALLLVDEVLGQAVHGATRVRALVRRASLDVDPAVAVARLESAVDEDHDDAILRARTRSELAWHRGAWLGDVDRAIVEAFLALDAAEAVADPPTILSALTTAGLLAWTAGDPRAEPLFRRAISLADGMPPAAGERSPRIAFAHDRWLRGEVATAQTLLAEERARATEHGNDGLLMRLNIFEAEVLMRRGRWDEAAMKLDQALTDAQDWWRTSVLVEQAILASRRGAADAFERVDMARASPAAQADSTLAALADVAEGLARRAEGRTGEAAALMAGLVLADAPGTRGLENAVFIPETVAVLAEAGRLDDVESLVAQLGRRRPQLAPWADAALDLTQGILLLARGEGEPALALLTQAIGGFELLGLPWELAQANEAAGRALRRLGRRRDAATRLETALQQYRDLGAAPAVRRTTDELARARPRARGDDALTSAERRVAARVAAGATNREVAAALFTTVATVEAHLTRIYAKLGVRSRTELARHPISAEAAPD